jgi:hypothetical protein
MNQNLKHEDIGILPVNPMLALIEYRGFEYSETPELFCCEQEWMLL